MKLLHYPNVILETKCDPVTEFDEELGVALDEMRPIMEQHNGIGLAAPQVGISKRFFILKTNKGEIYEIINPNILEVDGLVNLKEGCLSFPTIYLDIVRSQRVMFEYQTRTGETKQAMAEDVEARCFLHEYDHLEGKTFVYKVNREQRKIIKSKLKKILK